MTINRKAVRIWMRGINDVLNREWHPIVDCPEDEYEGYVGRLATLLRTRATDEEIMKFLEWAEIEQIGLSPPFDWKRGKKVIAALRALKEP